MCSNFRSPAVKYADKKRRLEISRDGSRNQVGSPSPPLPRRVQVLDLESTGNASLGSNGKVVVTVSLDDDDQVLATAHAAEVVNTEMRELPH